MLVLKLIDFDQSSSRPPSPWPTDGKIKDPCKSTGVNGKEKKKKRKRKEKERLKEGERRRWREKRKKNKRGREI